MQLAKKAQAYDLDLGAHEMLVHGQDARMAKEAFTC